MTFNAGNLIGLKVNKRKYWKEESEQLVETLRQSRNNEE